MKPSRHQFTVLRQVIELIPRNLVPKLANKHEVSKRARSFTLWSHVLSLVYTQLSHALSLNDVCDTMRNHSGSVATLRGAVSPSRNGLSHANMVRNADMAEDLFWQSLASLRSACPNFGLGRKVERPPCEGQ